jgi:coenzyme PQQ precursor peptide PqqA
MPISQVLYLDPTLRRHTLPQSSSPLRSLLKPLISGGFEHSPKVPRSLSRCSKDANGSSEELAGKRFHWRTFRSSVPYRRGRNASGCKKESQMAWKAPKIVEVPVGMEINMYACAARK